MERKRLEDEAKKAAQRLERKRKAELAEAEGSGSPKKKKSKGKKKEVVEEESAESPLEYAAISCRA
jgi:hypothetical protein